MMTPEEKIVTRVSPNYAELGRGCVLGGSVLLGDFFPVPS